MIGTTSHERSLAVVASGVAGALVWLDAAPRTVPTTDSMFIIIIPHKVLMRCALQIR